VAEQVGKIGKHKRNLYALPIYGGQAYDRQLHGLKRGAQIVIGTPGRLIDHLERGSLKLDQVKMVVLDEADEMLDMGFQEDMEKILSHVPGDRQTVLFSATMQPGIRRLATKFLRNPLTIKSSVEAMSVPAIEQAYMEVRGPMKLEALTRVLDFHRVKLGIVFCNTRIGVDELVEHLQARGYSAEGLHGEHKQNVRDRIMAKFRSRTVEILVATDVASRGIDVKDVEMVVNYDLPKDTEDYVHRIGRTGRAGKKGLALSFASGRDLFRLRNIESFSKIKIPPPGRAYFGPSGNGSAYHSTRQNQGDHFGRRIGSLFGFGRHTGRRGYHSLRRRQRTAKADPAGSDSSPGRVLSKGTRIRRRREFQS
jgi:ATP-dependent RNA helicase DeaD